MDVRTSGARGRAALVAALALAFAATSCGGEGRDREARPTIPRDLAEQLAAQSLGLAEALERGDSCAAAELADSLRASAGEAIDRGRVPAPLGDELEEAVARLSREIECRPPASREPEGGDDPEPEQEEDGEGGGDGGDVTTTSTTPDTTTTVEDTTTTTLEETTTLDEG